MSPDSDGGVRSITSAEAIALARTCSIVAAIVAGSGPVTRAAICSINCGSAHSAYLVSTARITSLIDGRTTGAGVDGFPSTTASIPSTAIRRYLGGSAEAVFQPHAEAVLHSCLHDRTLRVDPGSTPDALAMLPASHVVVVASLRTDLGASLLDGRISLIYDFDGAAAVDPRKRGSASKRSRRARGSLHGCAPWGVGRSATPCLMTRHPAERFEEMGLTEDDVEAALSYPEITYPSSPHYGPGRNIAVAGRLAVVHNGPTVITVLWHKRSGR